MPRNPNALESILELGVKFTQIVHLSKKLCYNSLTYLYYKTGEMMARSVVSIRLDDSFKQELKKEFGTVQGAIDEALNCVDKKTFCVYRITSNIDGKVYIGCTNNFKKRIRQHSYAKTDLGKDIRKYGLNNFVWEALAYAQSREIANEIEAYFITKMGAIGKGYNKAIGKGRFSGKKSMAVYVKVTYEERQIINELGGATKIIMDAVKEYEKLNRQRERVLKIIQRVDESEK